MHGSPRVSFSNKCYDTEMFLCYKCCNTGCYDIGLDDLDEDKNNEREGEKESEKESKREE